MDEGILLTMNAAQFETAIKKVVDGFNTMDKHAKKMSDQLGRSATDMASALMKKAAHMTVAFLSVRSALSFLPEIGRTFEASKNIIMRNLLWPLRKELMPLLQKILDWVRDHRIAFVKAGTIIVGVFRVVRTIVGGIIDVLRVLINRVANGIEAIFGKSTQSATDMINVLLFKIAAVFIILQSILEPVFDFIGKAINVVIGIFKDFFSGVIAGAGNLGKSFGGIGERLSEITRLLGNMNVTGSALGKTFKTLGIILGTGLKPILSVIYTLVTGIAQQLDYMNTMEQVLLKRKRGDEKGAKAEIEALNQRTKERIFAVGGEWKDTGMNFVNAGKEIKKTWSEPQVTATEKAVTQNKTNNSSMTQNNTIIVNGAKDPKDTGRAVHDELRKQKERSMVPR
ncbi:MAG TPA: hypothetical protein DSN98_07790 [Thermoplasmata archaeon]|jgi:hypothetical protein|nr:MAG TPA: hypothetical protein DSN98_07790 [Thermoplasmata archaeon]